MCELVSHSLHLCSTPCWVFTKSNSLGPHSDSICWLTYDETTAQTSNETCLRCQQVADTIVAPECGGLALKWVWWTERRLSSPWGLWCSSSRTLIIMTTLKWLLAMQGIVVTILYWFLVGTIEVHVAPHPHFVSYGFNYHWSKMESSRSKWPTACNLQSGYCATRPFLSHQLS